MLRRALVDREDVRSMYCPLPIGIDDFREMIVKNYYYVDKTSMIKELLDRRGKVNLFTRPRRFGKTLNLSMLKYFFEDTGEPEENQRNAELFQDLAISQAGEEYTKEMGSYPVIMLTLKSAKQNHYEMAFYFLKEAIAAEFARHEKAVIGKLSNRAEEEKFIRIRESKAEDVEYFTSLAFLSQCLYEAYKKPCIILIDEYDVPLESAYFSGFYEEMVSFIRTLFESSLKTNPYVEFAVVTGCLRVSRESIFTGLNNLEVISILRKDYGEYFGFVQSEVDRILQDYDLEDKHEIVKQWYDGYLFGDREVYNPWSIINFVKVQSADPDAFPAPYWANTSSNSIVKNLVERLDDAGGQMQEQLECLMNKGMIEKPVHEDITYENIFESEDNLWNFLFFTGYLKKVSSRQEEEEQIVSMSIPNMEVSYIYKHTISTWFERKQKGFDLKPLYEAIEQRDTEGMEEEISGFLSKTISYYDYGESYYHGFLAGLFGGNGNYRVLSNRETGLGRADLVLKTPRIRKGRAIVFELKAVKSLQELEKGCEAALRQIEEKKYQEELRQEGYENILAYGVCFYRKECAVAIQEDVR